MAITKETIKLTRKTNNGKGQDEGKSIQINAADQHVKRK